MRIVIVSSPKFPIPAVKGGAVQNLIEEIIAQNETEKKLNIVCCSIFDNMAQEESKKYSKTQFKWIHIPKIILLFDKMLYFIFKKIFRAKRLLSLSFFFQTIWYIFSVAWILKKDSFDKVIFENSTPVMFSLKLYGNKRKYKDKYYLHMHGVPRNYFTNKEIIRNCSSLICISQFVADAIVNDARLGLPPEKIKIMYNCIDTECFKPLSTQCHQKLRKKYNIPAEKHIILFVGRLCAEKGIAELLKAIKKIKRDDIVLVVAGANFYKAKIVSPYEDYLKQLCKEIEDKVIFIGYIDYDKMPEVYAVANIVCLPSIWEEPAGMTIIEAMACKKPVITTYSGGIQEYTGKGNCISVKRNSEIVDSIKENIIQLLDNPANADALSKNAYNQAIRYNKKYYYSQFLCVLNMGELS